MLLHYIELLSKDGKKEKISISSSNKDIKGFVNSKKFTGTVNILDDKKILWSIECVDGIFNGTCTKYIDYQPSTIYGQMSGYLSGNWRQPSFLCHYRNGILDGQVLFYKQDGHRQYLLTYSMGLLDGEQKEYTTSNTRIIHLYSRGNYTKSSKQFKNWLPMWTVPTLDEFASHKSIFSKHTYLNNMFK